VADLRLTNLLVATLARSHHRTSRREGVALRGVGPGSRKGDHRRVEPLLAASLHGPRAIGYCAPQGRDTLDDIDHGRTPPEPSGEHGSFKRYRPSFTHRSTRGPVSYPCPPEASGRVHPWFNAFSSKDPIARFVALPFAPGALFLRPRHCRRDPLRTTAPWAESSRNASTRSSHATPS
jgi:hypothetical protein